ncbi:acetyltransferase [Vibrio cholerae]|nr:acetyltransferase [Vibrio cholerae]MDN6983681.1 acetyltransferase [Vibrio cholerae]
MVAVVVFGFSVMRCQPLRRALCAYELKWRDNAAN